MSTLTQSHALYESIESSLNNWTPSHTAHYTDDDLAALSADYTSSFVSNWLGEEGDNGHGKRGGLTRISQIGKPLIVQACRLPHIQDELAGILPPSAPVRVDKDAIMHRRFHLGHVVEAEVVLTLRAHGYVITDTQTEVVMNAEHGVVGHCDGVLHWGGKKYVFDVKTMSDYSFSQYTKRTGPHDNGGYISQLACYHKLLGTDGAFILAYNKNSHLFRVLLLDEQRLEERWERAQRVVTALAGVTTLADLEGLPMPSAVPELYKRNETGLYVPHDSIKYEPERYLCYEIYTKKKWGKDKEYVKRCRTNALELLGTN